MASLNSYVSSIVRGLDYYTKTVFEITAKNEHSNGTICGGGRYDGLVEELGGEVVKIIFLMELAGLEGRKKLAKYDVASVVCYEGK